MGAGGESCGRIGAGVPIFSFVLFSPIFNTMSAIEGDDVSFSLTKSFSNQPDERVKFWECVRASFVRTVWS
jgi:hypothetical protein